MKEAIQIDIKTYLDIAVRRKWFIIIPFLFVTLASVGLAYLLPPIYKSTTTILVEPQKVPTEYVRSTVTSGIEERLTTISQQILSRTRLENIINELSLYPKVKGKVPMEQIVEGMRRDITLQVRGTSAFTLEYLGREPRQAMLVASRLASLFIEENLRTREQQAVSTSEFLDNELKSLKAQLETQEKAVHDFKLRYMGELPEQRDANLRTLDRLNQQAQNIDANLRNAQDRQVLVEGQLAERRAIMLNSPASIVLAGVSGIPAPVNSPLARLQALKAALLNLTSAGYTEKYPDVIRLKNEIQEVEAQAGIEKKVVESPAQEPGEVKVAKVEKRTEELLDPGLQNLRTQLEGLKIEVKNLRSERVALANQIKALQGRVENTPKREQEMTILSRDYNNTLNNYRTLLDKRLNAQIAENMEKRQKGEQFKILDPANLSEKPFKPNRPRIILMGILLGLAMGAGAAYLMENQDSSFKGEKEMKFYLKFPVLAVIPHLEEGNQKKGREIIEKLRYLTPFRRRAGGL